MVTWYLTYVRINDIPGGGGNCILSQGSYHNRTWGFHGSLGGVDVSDYLTSLWGSRGSDIRIISFIYYVIEEKDRPQDTYPTIPVG